MVHSLWAYDMGLFRNSILTHPGKDLQSRPPGNVWKTFTYFLYHTCSIMFINKALCDNLYTVISIRLKLYDSIYLSICSDSQPQNV